MPPAVSSEKMLNHEISMLVAEKNRRSSQQFEYVKLSLINIASISLLGILSIILESEKNGFNQKITDYSNVLFALMCVLSVVSITLFLFWIDDALTIGGIDRFLKNKEERIDVDGEIFWYEYRDALNKTNSFIFKKWIFNIAIFISFVAPPFLFSMFAIIHSIINIPYWFALIGGAFFLIALVVPLYIWRRFTKRLYG